MKKKTPSIPPELAVTHLDLSGKTVLVRGYSDPLNLFLCGGGFGCSPSAMGQKIAGRWLSDNAEDTIRRPEVVRLATPEEIAGAEAFQALPKEARWIAQLQAYLSRQEVLFEHVRDDGLKMTKGELRDQYNTLAHNYARLKLLVERHLDPIARAETTDGQAPDQ